MAKIIIIKSCDQCPKKGCGFPLPDCPLKEAPDVLVYKGEELWKPEEGSFFDAVFSALEFSNVPAYLEEIKP